MLRISNIKRIAILGCLLLMAALIPVAAIAASPVWVKIAENGITNPANWYLYPGVQFNGKLMIGSGEAPSASLYAYDGALAQVGSSGFGDANNETLLPYAVYQDFLYIGTGNTVRGQLWKWSGTGNPTQIAGVPWTGANNNTVIPLGVLNNKLLVCIANNVSGLSIYSFDGANWAQLIGQGSAGTPTGPGFGDSHNETIEQSHEVIYDGKLILPVMNGTSGLQVYSFDGTDFTGIGQAGAGSWDSYQKHGYCDVYYSEGLLYMGTTHRLGGPGQLWSYNGSSWSQVSTSGADAETHTYFPLARGEDLYLGTNNHAGARVYKKIGGSLTPICDPGIGDTANYVVTITSCNGGLFALTWNLNGGQVYMTPIAPSIDKMTPNSGPYGSTITIVGHDFGVTRGSGGEASSVTINGKTAEVVSWSDTSIQAIVPTRAAAGAVQVHTSTGDSNPVTFNITLSRTWYFAEGTTRDNTKDGKYEEWLCLQNPGSTKANAHITYMLGDGSNPTQDVVVGPTSRQTISVNDFLGPDKDVSALVESDQLILAERPMYFNYRNKWTGGHDVIGVPAPRTYYYFAEGTTRNNLTDGYFDEWLCFQNPGTTDAVVTVNYVLGTGKTVQKMYSAKAKSRYTVDVNTEVGPDQDVSCVVNSSQPIVAERPMYFNYHDRWTGGHDVVGAPGPDTEFYFAEGTTRDNARDGSFEEWICLQNATSTAAPVRITYYTEQAGTQTQDVTVGPTSRLTVDVNAKLGKDVDASCKVESTAGVPILAERPMYFNYHSAWDGGHDVMGCDAPKKSFYFAEGTTRAGFATWVAVMNPGSTDANVTFRYMLGDGSVKTASVVVAAEKRYTRDVLADVGADKDVSIVVEGNTEIVVERPMYFNYHGWCTGGHDTLGYGI